MLNDEKTLILASLIADKMKENYLLDCKGAIEEIIKELRQFSHEHGELIDQATRSNNRYDGGHNKQSKIMIL